jgi:hypothetical protein
MTEYPQAEPARIGPRLHSYARADLSHSQDSMPSRARVAVD